MTSALIVQAKKKKKRDRFNSVNIKLCLKTGMGKENVWCSGFQSGGHGILEGRHVVLGWSLKIGGMIRNQRLLIIFLR